jgi:hypothetical protein
MAANDLAYMMGVLVGAGQRRLGKGTFGDCVLSSAGKHDDQAQKSQTAPLTRSCRQTGGISPAARTDQAGSEGSVGPAGAARDARRGNDAPKAADQGVNYGPLFSKKARRPAGNRPLSSGDKEPPS